MIDEAHVSKRTLSLLLERPLVPLSILTMTVILCYYGLWQAYFATRDDFNILGWVMRQPSLWDAMQGYGNGVRYLLFGILWIRTELFGLMAAPYYWSSLAQHALVSFFVYWLVLSWEIYRPYSRLVALLVALFFVTSFSYYEVVTNISASSYSLRTLLYLPILIFFAAYLRQQRLLDYLIALVCYGLLAFMADYALSIPLMLLAYHYTIGQARLHHGLPRWRELQPHLPFWLLWALHVALQIGYLRSGSSEAIYSEAAYTPGLHMITNLFYLVFLLVPNVQIAPLQNFLNTLFDPALVNGIWQLSIGLALMAHGGAAVALWRGSPVIRFAIALIYLPFLQYTLWQDGYAAAPRYLYLSAIGYAIVAISALIALHRWVGQWKRRGASLLVPALLVGLMVINVTFAQTWIRQQVANGAFRRAVVEQLAREFKDVPPDAQIYIAIPAPKYDDLALACYFVIEPLVTCETVLQSASLPTAIVPPATDANRAYWLEVSALSTN
jgi:hypothetical protein